MPAPDFAFLKDRYDSELQRCNRLTDSLGLPVATLTAFGSLISVMLTGFTFGSGRLQTFFVATLVADVCAFAVCLLFLGIAYYRQDVAYLQSPGDLQDAWQTLQSADKGSALERFDDYLRRSTIEATDLNIASNDRRAGYLYRARATLIVVVVLTGVAAVPYVVNQVQVPKKTPVVHVDNLNSGGDNAR